MLFVLCSFMSPPPLSSLCIRARLAVFDRFCDMTFYRRPLCMMLDTPPLSQSSLAKSLILSSLLFSFFRLTNIFNTSWNIYISRFDKLSSFEFYVSLFLTICFKILVKRLNYDSLSFSSLDSYWDRMLYPWLLAFIRPKFSSFLWKSGCMVVKGLLLLVSFSIVNSSLVRCGTVSSSELPWLFFLCEEND